MNSDIIGFLNVPQLFYESDRDKYIQRAEQLFYEGYNCSQAVFAAFCDIVGIDKKTALMLSSGFGGGIGRQREVCGAVSGMVMTASSFCGYDDANDNAAKAKHYQLIQYMCGRFREQSGSIICRELLGLKSGADSPIPSRRDEHFYKKRPCGDYVKIAAEIICDTFKKRQ